MTGAQAWAVLGAGVALYELAADEDELLTRAVRRGRSRHTAANWAIVGGVLVIAGHLLEVIPPAVDPFRALFVLRGLR